MSWLEASGEHAQRQPWRPIWEPQKRAGARVPEGHPLEEPAQEAPQHFSLRGGEQLIPHPVSPARAQREQIERERLVEEKRTSERMQHVQELRRQVRENQQKLVQERIATFEEGRRLKEEAQRRSERINDVKKKKIEELRYSCRSSSGPPRGGRAGELGFRDRRARRRRSGGLRSARGSRRTSGGLGLPGSLGTSWQEAGAWTGICLGDESWEWVWGVQGPRPALWRPSPYTLNAVFPRRATGLPEKYCIEAERKANILPATPVS